MKKITIRKIISNYHTGDKITWCLKNGNGAILVQESESLDDDAMQGGVVYKTLSFGQDSNIPDENPGGTDVDANPYVIMFDDSNVTDSSDVHNGILYFDCNENGVEHSYSFKVKHGDEYVDIAGLYPVVKGDDNFNKYYGSRWDNGVLYIKPKQANDSWYGISSNDNALRGTFSIYIQDADAIECGQSSDTWTVCQRTKDWVYGACPYRKISLSSKSVQFSSDSSAKSLDFSVIECVKGESTFDRLGIGWDYANLESDAKFTYDSSIEGCIKGEIVDGKIKFTLLKSNTSSNDITGNCYVEIGDCGVLAYVKLTVNGE